jgi:hypothetical protein
MVYVRVSQMLPNPGSADRVTELLDDLSRFYATQPGYIEGWRLASHAPAAHVGRLGLWESEGAAVVAAQSDHALAVRSELNLVVQSGSHEEHAYEGIASG